MKTSTIIWYIVIAVVLYYLIYKAYTNYQASGSIFRSTAIVPATSSNVVIVEGQNPATVSRFVATGGQQMDPNY